MEHTTGVLNQMIVEALHRVDGDEAGAGIPVAFRAVTAGCLDDADPQVVAEDEAKARTPRQCRTARG